MHNFSVNNKIILQNFSYPKLLKFIANKNNINFSIDSRLLKPQDIFIALKGDSSDGHGFIQEVIKKHAGLVIAEHIPKNIEPNLLAKILCVPDTWKFFSELAKYYLEQFEITKIVLSGSNGKTTTKELIYAGLKSVLDPEKIFVSAKNFNNHFGVPLNIFCVNNSHKIAIFELGMNHAGELAHLCSIIKPDFGVLTNIGTAHVGNFPDNILGVANAKGEIFASLNNKKHAIINLDNKYIVNQADKYNFATKTTFGTKPESDYKFLDTTNFSLDSNTQITKIQSPQGEINFELSLPGLHNAYNSLCALTVIGALGFDIKKAAAKLKHIKPEPGRMHMAKLSNGAILIDDSYNANPESFKAGILSVSQISGRRKIGIFGFMAELGINSEQYHFELGKLLAPIFNKLIICYNQSQAIILGARQAGFSKKDILFFNSNQEAILPLKKLICAQDLIYTKGSRSSGMDTISRALLQDKTL